MMMVARYNSDLGPAEITTDAIMLDVQDSLFEYDFPRSAAELGAELSLGVTVDVLRDLPGPAEVELAGLPNGVTSSQPIQPITAESTSVTFPISVAADAKVGKHKTLVCLSRVKVGEETIVQTAGTGELRIDKPLPAKDDAAKAKPKPEAKKKPEKAAAKPLSRLEQLRQMKD